MKGRILKPRDVIKPRRAADCEQLQAIVYDEVLQHLLRGARDEDGARLQALGVAKRVTQRCEQ